MTTKLQSYLVEIGQRTGGRNERELLSTAIDDDRADCYWFWSELTGYDQAEKAVIVPKDLVMLHELEKAGWSVRLAPAAVYPAAPGDETSGCTVSIEGAIPERLPA